MVIGLTRSRITILLLLSGSSYAASVSPLYIRGYAVIPEPQSVRLKTSDFRIDGPFRLKLGDGLSLTDGALLDLKEQMADRYHMNLLPGGQGTVVELAIHPRSIAIGAVTDRD